MNIQDRKDSAIPPKTPLYEAAVILCSRCKVRYQAAYIFTSGRTCEFLICPRCLSRIPVDTVGTVAPAREVRGNSADHYSIPLTPNHDL
ncbi:MAG: hypothetical protein AB7U29_15140, partial [Desulfobulbus sp.]